MKKPAKPESEAAQKKLILWPWVDAMQEGGLPEVAEYAAHVGIDLKQLGGGAATLEQAVLRHYQCGRRRYDIDRAARDLATYPPVAARIAELTAQRSSPK